MKIKKLLLPASLFLLIVAADQVSKILVRDYFQPKLPEQIHAQEFSNKYLPRLENEAKELLRENYLAGENAAVFLLDDAIQKSDAETLKKGMIYSGLIPPKGKPVPVIGKFFWLNYHENTGVAFGMFSGLPESVSIPLFTIITIAAVWVIINFYKEFKENQKIPRLALISILGGAIGNLIDRLVFGRVTDFFDLAMHNPYRNLWPIFNVADCFIVIGIAVLVCFMLREKRLEKSTETAMENHS